MLTLCGASNAVSDIPHDHCHGLNQSAMGITGPDIIIKPASSVKCRMQAIQSDMYTGA